jgi:hypothetical protein
MAGKLRTEIARRAFLRGAGASAGAAVGAVAVGLSAEPAQAQSTSVPDGKVKRYRESEQVKTYYRVNRY